MSKRKKIKLIMFTFLLVLVLCLVGITQVIYQTNLRYKNVKEDFSLHREDVSQELKEVSQELEDVSQELEDVSQEIDTVKQRVDEHSKEIDAVQDTMEEVRVVTSEVTAYAPLDPRAVEGMCFEGNPKVTASGEEVEPGVTVAAGEQIPLGTEVYIEGIGRRIVQDRGGAIGSRDIDIAVTSKDEALQFGRQERRVVIPK